MLVSPVKSGNFTSKHEDLTSQIEDFNSNMREKRIESGLNGDITVWGLKMGILAPTDS
jgi:hypothetical protein